MVKKTITLALLLLLFAAFANAQTISISMDKNLFFPGEKIEIKISALNDEEIDLNFFLEYYFMHSETFYSSYLNGDALSLAPGEEKTIEFTQEVSENMPSGIYVMSAVLWSMDLEKTGETAAKFEIHGTKKETDLKLLSCRDKKCTSQTKVFIKGEKIFLDFYSNTGNTPISAQIEFPDGTIEEIVLPHQMQAIESGTYSISAVTEKEGFKKSEATLQIGVLKKEPEIAFVQPELAKTPTPAPTTTPPGPGISPELIALIAIIAAIGIIAVFLLARKNKKGAKK